MKKTLFILFVTLSLTFFSNAIIAQEKQNEPDKQEEAKLLSFNFGADFVSRYVWRGMEFGSNTPHIQPWGTFTFDLQNAGKVDLGVWASYGLASEKSSYAENDFNFKYTYDFGKTAGSVYAVVNDYYYPTGSNPNFSSWAKDGKGAHTIETGLGYVGPENLPFTVYASVNAYNVPLDTNGNKEKSFYFEFGYKFKVKEVDLSPVVGVAQGVSSWHQVSTDKYEFINVGLTAAKTIKVSNDFSIPAAISWIWNPHLKTTYTVFKLSF